jgi:two-component system OmpR family response regulator
MRQPQGKLSDPPDVKSQAAAAEPTVRQPCEKPGVLVVDDDRLVRIMVQLGLERNGFEVWLARNGREAIDLYRAHRENIGIVLLDVRMPGLDGPQTLEALRELDPEVLACFMGGNTDACEPDALVQRGAVYVIIKPFLLADLANILRLLTHGVSADRLPSGRLRHGENREEPKHGGENTHDLTRKSGELQGSFNNLANPRNLQLPRLKDPETARP